MEAINKKEFIDKMKSYEEKLKHIEMATQIENEIQNSVALPLIIKVAKSEADDALRDLATVEPSDVKKIISLQAKIYRAIMIEETLMAIKARGAFAAESIQENGDLLNGEEIREDR